MLHANVYAILMDENVIQIKIRVTTNVDVSVKIWKRMIHVKKDWIWISGTCAYENCRYAKSNIGDSMIMNDEVIKETKTVPTKSTWTITILTKSTFTKNIPSKSTSTDFYMLLSFLLITIA